MHRTLSPIRMHYRRARTLARAVAFLGIAATVACSPHSLPAKSAEHDRAELRNDESNASSSAKGRGHLHLTGDVVYDGDFGVDGCAIGAPGQGLLDGYRMQAQEGDSSITLLSVLLRNFTKDGPYTADTSSDAQLKEGMRSGSFSPLTLMITRPESPMPMSFGLTSSSSLVIDISGNGAKGEAKISNMESQPTFQDIKLDSKEKPHGKRVSGSVTWSCGHVDHQNAEMSKAVDGMMNKLMPH